MLIKRKGLALLLAFAIALTGPVGLAEEPDIGARMQLPEPVEKGCPSKLVCFHPESYRVIILMAIDYHALHDYRLEVKALETAIKKERTLHAMELDATHLKIDFLEEDKAFLDKELQRQIKIGNARRVLWPIIAGVELAAIIILSVLVVRNNTQPIIVGVQ